LDSRGVSHRELEQQGFQTLRTTLEHEGASVCGNIEAGKARQPRPLVQERTARHEEILPATVYRIWGVRVHVGPQTQQPGGESIVFQGQHQIARHVLPAVQRCLTAEDQWACQVVTLACRLHKGPSGGEVAGSSHITAIPESEKSQARRTSA
jgi:hypothetical protein